MSVFEQSFYQQNLSKEDQLKEYIQEINCLHYGLDQFVQGKSIDVLAVSEIKQSDPSYQAKLQLKATENYHKIYIWERPQSKIKKTKYSQVRIHCRKLYKNGMSDQLDLSLMLAQLIDWHQKSIIKKKTDILVFCQLDSDFLKSLVKIRAAKYLFYKCAQQLGIKTSQIQLIATASSRLLAPKDPWINLIKLQSIGLSAYLAGADQVSLGTPDQMFYNFNPLLESVVRDFHRLISEEVFSLENIFNKDIMRGSWWVELQTLEFCKQVQVTLEQILDKGGYRAYLQSSDFQERYNQEVSEFKSSLKTQNREAMGVNIFLDQTPDDVRKFNEKN